MSSEVGGFCHCAILQSSEGDNETMPTELKPTKQIEGEPRWPAMAGMIAIGGLFYALPSAMTVGPDWLVVVLVAGLLTPAMLFHRAGMYKANQIFGYLAQ